MPGKRCQTPLKVEKAVIVGRTRDLVSRTAPRQGGVKGGPLLCPN